MSESKEYKIGDKVFYRPGLDAVKKRGVKYEYNVYTVYRIGVRIGVWIPETGIQDRFERCQVDDLIPWSAEVEEKLQKIREQRAKLEDYVARLYEKEADIIEGRLLDIPQEYQEGVNVV